jgi:glycerate kinase
LSSIEVAAAIGRGLARAGIASVDLAPVADGGEGTLEVLLARHGGERVTAAAHDALGRSLDTQFGLLGDGATALVEVAAASGLTTMAPDDRDAEAASSAGTGELIVAAVAAGAKHVIVAAGGSATTDGGRGALAAIAAGGGLRGATITVLCDVRIPFELAPRRFGPQKGADPEAVARLTDRLQTLAAGFPRDPRGMPMGGAAGGLAGGLWAALGAQLRGGAAFVLDSIDFDARLRGSHAVIVGEGRLDLTTLDGKIVCEIATRARQIGVPAHAIVGEDALDRFDARILDLQMIIEASDLRAIEAAAEAVVAAL